MNTFFILTVRVLILFSMFGCAATPSTAQETLTAAFSEKAAKYQVWPNYQQERVFREPLSQSSDKKPGSLAGPIWGGLLGGAVGFVGGAFLGAATCRDCGFGAIANSIAGATIGEVVVMPLGVHFGNRRQGNFGLDLLTSVAAAGSGILLITALNADEPWLIAVPVFQIGATVTVERVTARP